MKNIDKIVFMKSYEIDNYKWIYAYLPTTNDVKSCENMGEYTYPHTPNYMKIPF